MVIKRYPARLPDGRRWQDEVNDLSDPEITELVKIVPNRYKLVRAVAKRAVAIEKQRHPSLQYKENPVLQALREIYEGTTKVELVEGEGNSSTTAAASEEE